MCKIGVGDLANETHEEGSERENTQKEAFILSGFEHLHLYLFIC